MHHSKFAPLSRSFPHALAFLVLLVAGPALTWGQVQTSFYLEPYINQSFSAPRDNNHEPFIYSYDRHGELAVNLAFARAAYTTPTLRSNLALMTGTYAEANLGSEPPLFRNIMEANVGIRLLDSADLWLDVGVMPSHIGFESAIGMDCWNLTRSLLADNSPYYETGAKVSYTNQSGSLMVSGMLLNGWQRIRRLDGASGLAGGSQVTFRPNSTTVINWSTYLGSEPYGDGFGQRVFSNFYITTNIWPRLNATVGVDAGTQNHQNKGASEGWWGLIGVLRQEFTRSMSASFRAEHFSDPGAVVLATSTPVAPRLSSSSVNIDWRQSSNVLARIEARVFHSQERAFTGRDGNPDYTFFTLSSALAISF